MDFSLTVCCLCGVGADLHLERVGRFIAAVGQYEDKIFQARMRKMRADKNRFLSQKFSSNGGSRQVSEPNGSNHIASERTGDGSNDRVQLNSKDPKHFLASTAGNNSSNHGVCLYPHFLQIDRYEVNSFWPLINAPRSIARVLCCRPY